MKLVCLFCDSRSINEATSYYISLIKASFISFGFDFYISHNLKNVKESNIVLTVSGQYALKSKIRYPFKPVVYWMQGIRPEEIAIWGEPKIKQMIFSFIDFFALHTCKAIFFVSEEMRKHCNKKYLWRGNNYFIMPCYNLPLCGNFNINQYTQPSFVYAGNISVWQNVDEILAS